METRIFNTIYGEVKLRNVMLDIDGTTLEDGIDIYLNDDLVGDKIGWVDLEELTNEDAEKIINRFL